MISVSVGRRQLWRYSSPILLGVLFGGCALIPAPAPPRSPEPPRFRAQSMEDVVNTRAVINFHRTGFRISDATAKLFAVFDFDTPVTVQSPGGRGGAGTLVGDMLTIALGQRGIKTVERQHLQRLLQEQGVIERNRNLTPEEIARLVGQIAKADHLIVGAVTEFESANRDVPIPLFVPEDERDRYTKDYGDYMTRFDEYKRNFKTWAMLAAPMFLAQEPEPKALPIEKHEELAAARTRSQLGTVANIGVTMRVLDVTTGEVVWVGQGAKRHMQLQHGLQILTQELIDSLLR